MNVAEFLYVNEWVSCFNALCEVRAENDMLEMRFIESLDQPNMVKCIGLLKLISSAALEKCSNGCTDDGGDRSSAPALA